MKPFVAVLGLHGTERVRVVSEALHDPDFVIIEQMERATNAPDRLSYMHKDSIFIVDLAGDWVQAFPRHGWSPKQERYM